MMKKFIGLYLLCSVSFAGDYSEKLKADLYKALLEAHKPLTYKQAGEILFTKLDPSGSVCSVYTPAICLPATQVPDAKIMNIEHTWPQSNGANGFAKSDLHHLFPVDAPSNSIRSSLPFCDVKISKWENGNSKRGFNQFNDHCFEPPAEHKGNVARALFYFSIRYQHPIDDHEEFFLRKWHLANPANQEEKDRNEAILKFQNISNPFIDNPSLVEQIVNF